MHADHNASPYEAEHRQEEKTVHGKKSQKEMAIEKKHQSFHALDRFGSDDNRLQNKLSHW
jgi:hypothetical protein